MTKMSPVEIKLKRVYYEGWGTEKQQKKVVS